jgi:hypothetical protein
MGTKITQPIKYKRIKRFLGYRVGTNGTVQSCKISNKWKDLVPC